ncbi:MAG: flagellar export protein FliJ [Treponema sp.]|jgi:flagellar FliJ protein|nr:flagellar export protein FliJ [Treponema sp.]
MKRFRFNLEKVLKLRQYREQETKIELGKAISILTEIENHIKQNAAQRSHAAQERFADPASTPAWDNYILRLEQQTERLMNDAAQAQLVVEKKRELYLDASRELKVIEKLKEQREQEYRKEMFAAETKERDDIRRKPVEV